MKVAHCIVLILVASGPAVAGERDAATLKAWDAFQVTSKKLATESRALSVAFRAADKEASTREKAARTAHTRYLATLAEDESSIDTARDDWGAADVAAKKARADALAKRKHWLDTAKAQRTIRTAATDAVRVAFAKSDWNVWKKEGDDAALLEMALGAVARHAAESDRPEAIRAAVRAWETLVGKLPNSRTAGYARARYLPSLYLATGDFKMAEAKIRALHDAAGERDRPGLLVHLGDLKALGSDMSAARRLFEEASAGIPKEGLERGDPRARLPRYIDLRLALIGNVAPEIASRTWFGGVATPLSKLKGRVVVLDFWATLCSPCRSVMPKLDALHSSIVERGGTVLGITRFYANGFLPNVGDDIHDGTSIRGMDEAAFLGHVAKFKARTGIDYPFVIASKESFTDYKISGIPTVVVIGIDGRVRFVAVGGGSEPIIRLAVERALAELKK